jgi:hypothetical protein
MKSKPDPTPKAKPLGEFWRGEGNRKIPEITLPRVRALETFDPDEQPDGDRPNESVPPNPDAFIIQLIIVDPPRCEHKPRKSPDCTCS